MEGLGRLMESIQRLRQSLNPDLEIEGIVVETFHVQYVRVVIIIDGFKLVADQANAHCRAAH